MLPVCWMQLRFNKVSELIHNSTNFRNLDQARVTVYFQEIIDKVLSAGHGVMRWAAAGQKQYSLQSRATAMLWQAPAGVTLRHERQCSGTSQRRKGRTMS
jgi:hypothetical protein